MTQREGILAAARAWIGTPFLPGACVRGRGCDCGSFLAGVMAEAGIIGSRDLGRYDYLAPVRKGDPFYETAILQHAIEVAEGAAQPGDIVLYRMGRGWGHAALIVDWPRAIIHAVHGRGVTAARGDGGRLAGRARRFFKMRGVA